VSELISFRNLIEGMRAVAEEHGFMSDEDINAEIRAARADIKIADYKTCCFADGQCPPLQYVAKK